MPALLKRSSSHRSDATGRTPSPAIASLIASLETNIGEFHSHVSHREFREFVRDYGRSVEEAWEPIRTNALNGGHR